MTSSASGSAPMTAHPVLMPGSTLGVLGGGQLGRMFVHAAQRMGYRTVVLDPDTDSPAGRSSDLHVQRAYLDDEGLHWLAEQGRGVAVGPARVPIVPSAVIFDLTVGDAQHLPDAALGRAACASAIARRLCRSTSGPRSTVASCPSRTTMLPCTMVWRVGALAHSNRLPTASCTAPPAMGRVFTSNIARSAA